jgi:hypothetical protein
MNYLCVLFLFLYASDKVEYSNWSLPSIESNRLELKAQPYEKAAITVSACVRTLSNCQLKTEVIERLSRLPAESRKIQYVRFAQKDSYVFRVADARAGLHTGVFIFVLAKNQKIVSASIYSRKHDQEPA